MSDLSFAVARNTTLSTNSTSYRKIDLPFDANAKFNRVIAQKHDNPNSIVHSINPNQILRKLNEDDLTSLLKITLKCSYVHNDFGLWDVLFNVINREGLTACIFVANKDYQPIAKERVATSSHYLNLELPVSRIHCNKVNDGDKIGIGIYDTRSQHTYVLLYTVAGSTNITETLNGEDGRVNVFPAINCQLEQIYRVDQLGQADVVDVEDREEDTADAQLFVEYVVNSANDITSAYPWKPHFQPWFMRGFEKEKVEADILVELERVVDGRYEDVEEEARDIYNISRNKRQDAIRRTKFRKDGQNQPDKKKKSDNKIALPILSIIDSGEYITAIIPARDSDLQNKVVRFSKTTVGKASVVEKYLLSLDIDRGNLVEASGIYLLSEETFGKDAFFRQLTVNF